MNRPQILSHWKSISEFVNSPVALSKIHLFSAPTVLYCKSVETVTGLSPGKSGLWNHIARTIFHIVQVDDNSLASASGPLCMLNTAGKVFEKFIRSRLEEAMRAAIWNQSREIHGAGTLPPISMTSAPYNVWCQKSLQFRKMDRYIKHIRKLIPRTVLSLVDIEGIIWETVFL